MGRELGATLLHGKEVLVHWKAHFDTWLEDVHPSRHFTCCNEYGGSTVRYDTACGVVNGMLRVLQCYPTHQTQSFSVQFYCTAGMMCPSFTHQ